MRQRPALMLLATALLLAACAAPAERSNMTVEMNPAVAAPADTSLIDAIAVGSVDGGEATHALGTSKVDNEDFQSALMDSLRNNGLLEIGRASCRERV